MMRITRPALRFIEPEVVDNVPKSASMIDGFRLIGLEPHPWLPGDAYHIPFFFP